MCIQCVGSTAWSLWSWLNCFKQAIPCWFLCPWFKGLMCLLASVTKLQLNKRVRERRGEKERGGKKEREKETEIEKVFAYTSEWQSHTATYVLVSRDHCYPKRTVWTQMRLSGDTTYPWLWITMKWWWWMEQRTITSLLMTLVPFHMQPFTMLVLLQ